MKILSLSLFALFITLNGLSYAADSGICKKCQLVREYNEEHPSKYEFYDDYLKDKEAGIADEIRFTDENYDLK